MSSNSSTESPKGGDHHVSEPINEELRYLYVSNVKVSNFVSVKLLDKSNYTLWMEQMLCLLDSQSLRGFVDDTVDPPEIKSFTIRQQYKSLVKGWIFRSLNEVMLKRVIKSGGPQEIWSALETICHPKVAPTGSTGCSSTELPKAGDHVSEPINEEELRYLYASNVNVSNFVSVKLLDKSKYTPWKKQMLCLLDSQNLRGFVDDTVHPPEIKSPNIKKQYNSLVEGWIYGSLNEFMLKVLESIEGPRSIWSALKAVCDPQKAPKGSGSSSTESSKGGDVSDQSINEEDGGDVSDQSVNEEEGGDVSDQPINEEELRYRYASYVNVSNFVSVSLLTKSNYATWSKQMLCLLDSENLRGFVDATVDPPEIKRLDIHFKHKILVRSWILSSVDEDMQWKVWDGNLRSLWQKVKRLYDSEAADPRDDAFKKRVLDVVYPEQVEVTTTTETETPPDNSTIRNDKLLKAVVNGRWLEAKLILKNDKDAATAALTKWGETVLHVAVREGRNNFLERLLDFIDDENIIKVTNKYRETALHTAAIKNNKRAAQLLVKKCKSLLFCVDEVGQTALRVAYQNNSLHTFLYLWKAVNDEQGKPEAINHDEDEIRRSIDFRILEDAISRKQYGE